MIFLLSILITVVSIVFVPFILGWLVDRFLLWNDLGYHNWFIKWVIGVCSCVIIGGVLIISAGVCEVMMRFLK